jgi:uncharacterized protein (TIGR00251 family)
LKIKVVPGARRTEIVGRYDDGLKVRVAAPPEGGKANQALIEVLARELGVKNEAVRIVRGHASPHKVVEIDGLSPADALARLTPPRL